MFLCLGHRMFLSVNLSMVQRNPWLKGSKDSLYGNIKTLCMKMNGGSVCGEGSKVPWYVWIEESPWMQGCKHSVASMFQYVLGKVV